MMGTPICRNETEPGNLTARSELNTVTAYSVEKGACSSICQEKKEDAGAFFCPSGSKHFGKESTGIFSPFQSASGDFILKESPLGRLLDCERLQRNKGSLSWYHRCRASPVGWDLWFVAHLTGYRRIDTARSRHRAQSIQRHWQEEDGTFYRALFHLNLILYCTVLEVIQKPGRRLLSIKSALRPKGSVPCVIEIIRADYLDNVATRIKVHKKITRGPTGIDEKRSRQVFGQDLIIFKNCTRVFCDCLNSVRFTEQAANVRFLHSNFNRVESTATATDLQKKSSKPKEE